MPYFVFFFGPSRSLEREVAARSSSRSLRSVISVSIVDVKMPAPLEGEHAGMSPIFKHASASGRGFAGLLYAARTMCVRVVNCMCARALERLHLHHCYCRLQPRDKNGALREPIPEGCF